MSSPSIRESDASFKANAPDAAAKAAKRDLEKITVSLTVNGQRRGPTIEPRMTLLDALREEFALTGTKKGCDRGECGACTVHVNGRRILSCMTLAAMQEGKSITTIEGLERDGARHPLQAAFIERDGFQCGFCTSGQIMSGVAMIEEAKAGWPSAATADVTKPFRLGPVEHGNPGTDERQSLPLRLLSQHRRGGRRCSGQELNDAPLRAFEGPRSSEGCRGSRDRRTTRFHCRRH